MFCNYQVKENESQRLRNNNLNKGLHYDIHIGRCVWEQEASLIVLFYDVSEYVMSNRKLKLQEYTDKILCSISHNLKTPLNAIILYNQNLLLNLQPSESPGAYEQAIEIHNNA